MKKKKNTKIFSFSAVIFSAITLGGLLLGRKKGKRSKETVSKKQVSWKETLLWTAVSALISSFSKLLVAQTSRKAERRFREA